MKTIGATPCKIIPYDTKEIFDTNRNWTRMNFWDRAVHLDGKSNWQLASDLLAQLNMTDHLDRLDQDAKKSKKNYFT